MLTDSSLNLEPKQEPEDDRDTESPLIRVCDTPSSTRSQSPNPSPEHPSPIPPTNMPIFPPMMIPPMMFLNPYLSLPLQRFPSLPLPPLLPPHLQPLNNETKPKSTLPFSIDNILKTVPRSMSVSPPVKSVKETSPRAVTKTRSMSPDDMKPGSPMLGDPPPGVTKDADCPPGMVRGPNGKLVPAWVFCTRYSDRPSSGIKATYVFITLLFGVIVTALS